MFELKFNETGKCFLYSTYARLFPHICALCVLLNYKQKFSSEADYIFFVHFVYQQMNMTSRINIAMRNVKTNELTAGMLSQNFKDTI